MRYDRGQRYDSGARYDQPDPPPHTKKRMSLVRLELDQLNDEGLQALATAHVAEMNGNANFPTPAPTVAAFATVLSSYEAKLLAADQARQAALAATQEKDSARDALEAALTARGGYVQEASGGVAAKILSSGFGVRDVPAPIGALPAPVDFLPTLGDDTGEMDLAWSKVRGAKSYVAQWMAQGGTGAWSQQIVTRSKCTVEGLTSGTVYVFRVAAVGAAGQSPWSLEAARRAP